ncbi:MAG TPA: hypothetical protein VIT91_20995 [Chthoniobacterales bacterium]
MSHPLGLLTDIASRVLIGDDYAGAAQRARDLILCCDYVLALEQAAGNEIPISAEALAVVASRLWREDEYGGEYAAAERARELVIDCSGKRPAQRIPWIKAVREITCKNTETKAELAFRPVFRLWVQRIFRKSGEDLDKIYLGCIDQWKKRGMTVELRDELRKFYVQQPRRASRKKRDL